MVTLAIAYHPFKFGQKDNSQANKKKISKLVNISSYFSWEGQGWEGSREIFIEAVSGN
jgi:hypothetical protein